MAEENNVDVARRQIIDAISGLLAKMSHCVEQSFITHITGICGDPDLNNNSLNTIYENLEKVDKSLVTRILPITFGIRCRGSPERPCAEEINLYNTPLKLLKQPVDDGVIRIGYNARCLTCRNNIEASQILAVGFTSINGMQVQATRCPLCGEFIRLNDFGDLIGAIRRP